MKNSRMKYILLYSIALIPIIITLLLYNKLPELYPIHWNIHGQIDNYGGRSSSFITACVPLIIIVLMQVMPLIDPKKRNYENFKSSYFNFQLMFAVLMGALHLLTLSAALGYEFIKVESGIKLLIAVMFTLMGNLMPKFKHNYFIGIKTPWTLASEEIWFATHRLGGKLWFYGGLIMIIVSFISGYVSAAVYFVVIMLMTFIPMLYSYLLFRKMQKQD